MVNNKKRKIKDIQVDDYDYDVNLFMNFMINNKKRKIKDIHVDNDDVNLLMNFVRETWFLHTDCFFKKKYRVRPKRKRRYNTRGSRK